MAVRRALRSMLVLLGALGLSAGLPLAASADGTVAFTIDDERITESSGLARDTDAGGYWTINDSGAGPIAYRLGKKGDVVGTLSYRADPVDVEAVAMHDRRLYLADIGDNAADRKRVTVYYFNDAQANDRTVAYRSWEFAYPDGPHDAETLLVDGSGRLLVVTKDVAAGGIYAAPASPKRSETNQLTRVGDAPLLVTDGTFLPGGDRIALLTMAGIELLDAKSYAVVGHLPLPGGEQPESITVSLDGKSLLVGSEGKDSKVYAVAIPAAGSGAPSGSPTDGTDEGTEPDPADDADVAPSGQGRARTLLALGVAGLVAVIAGSVVVTVRKR